MNEIFFLLSRQKSIELRLIHIDIPKKFSLIFRRADRRERVLTKDSFNPTQHRCALAYRRMIGAS